MGLYSSNVCCSRVNCNLYSVHIESYEHKYQNRFKKGKLIYGS